MSNASTRQADRPGRFTLAVIGLVLTLISPVAWALTLDHSFLRRTGLMMWIIMGLGLVCAAAAAMGDRRTRTRLVAILASAWVASAITIYFVFTRLPAPGGDAANERISDFTLSSHLGQPVTLSGLLNEGHVLLVFYRGYW